MGNYKKKKEEREREIKDREEREKLLLVDDVDEYVSNRERRKQRREMAIRTIDYGVFNLLFCVTFYVLFSGRRMDFKFFFI
jgi:hypothetical protein